MHPSHRTRYSDSSLYDEVCVLCGATDSPHHRVNGIQALKAPCSAPDEERKEYDEGRSKVEVRY